MVPRAAPSARGPAAAQDGRLGPACRLRPPRPRAGAAPSSRGVGGAVPGPPAGAAADARRGPRARAALPRPAVRGQPGRPGPATVPGGWSGTAQRARRAQGPAAGLHSAGAGGPAQLPVRRGEPAGHAARRPGRDLAPQRRRGALAARAAQAAAGAPTRRSPTSRPASAPRPASWARSRWAPSASRAPRTTCSARAAWPRFPQRART